MALAIVVVLTWSGLAAVTGPTAVAAAASTQVFSDSRTDVPSGIGLYRTRVTNRAELIVTTKHRDLRKLAHVNSFTIFVDTRTSRPGPEFAITGGLSNGTDWVTGRATRHWHVRGDPLDAIGLCHSDLTIHYKTDKVRVKLGRDCLGGYQGRVRVSVSFGDGTYIDYGPAKKTFAPWVARG